MPNLEEDDEDEDFSPNDRNRVTGGQRDEQGKSYEINVVFEQQNHHSGSVYCVDWSRTSRLIATGSNDKTIKLLVCPDFEQSEHDELLEMVLEGH